MWLWADTDDWLNTRSCGSFRVDSFDRRRQFDDTAARKSINCSLFYSAPSFIDQRLRRLRSPTNRLVISRLLWSATKNTAGWLTKLVTSSSLSIDLFPENSNKGRSFLTHRALIRLCSVEWPLYSRSLKFKWFQRHFAISTSDILCTARFRQSRKLLWLIGEICWLIVKQYQLTRSD